MPLEIGSVVEGVITGITNFGAFVKLPEGNTGLIHISEVANTYVKDVHEFINEKDQVRVKVLGINNKGKYDLSLKQVEQETGEKLQEEVKEIRTDKRDFNGDKHADTREYPRKSDNGEDRRDGRHEYHPRNKAHREFHHRDDRRDHFQERGFSFEDKLTRYMKESEERLLDLKRNTEAKRGRKR